MQIVNGWTLFAHPSLLSQFEKMAASAEKIKARAPETYATSPEAKLLAQLKRLIFEVVPNDPTNQTFRQGGTLGAQRKHWLSAKFGAGRFRLFFRYSVNAKVIIFAWVKDSETLRTYGSKTDAYAVFKGMLDKGNPPDDWIDLMKVAKPFAS